MRCSKIYKRGPKIYKSGHIPKPKNPKYIYKIRDYPVIWRLKMKEKQAVLISEGEPHVLMSAQVPKRWNQYRIEKGMTWKGLVALGIEKAQSKGEEVVDEVSRQKIVRMSALLDAAYKRIQQLETKVDVSVAEHGNH